MPFPPGVFERADQFLFLGIHADHGIAAVLVLTHPVVEITELGVTVWVLAALDRLRVGLQAKPFRLKQLGHRRR
jgi:hypothetical protein